MEYNQFIVKLELFVSSPSNELNTLSSNRTFLSASHETSAFLANKLIFAQMGQVFIPTYFLAI